MKPISKQLEAAFVKVDQALRDIKIRNRNSGFLVPRDIAVMFIKRFHGEDWDRNISDALDGRIDASTFEARQMELVKQYSKYLFQLRMERKLSGEGVHIPSYEIEEWDESTPFLTSFTAQDREGFPLSDLVKEFSDDIKERLGLPAVTA